MWQVFARILPAGLLLQAKAARRWRALQAAGANPTLHSIRADIAIWCRNEGVKTKTLCANPAS